jgi:hypothetical protein
MPSHLAAEAAMPSDAAPTRPFRTRALLILWPSFLMASVLEMMVFAVVDPSSMTWFGMERIDWSRSAIYSVTFFIFWGVVATSGAITALLEAPGTD